MDATRYYSSTEHEAHPNYPASDDGTLGSTDISAFSDEGNNDQFHGHSTLRSTLDTQVYLLDKERIAAVDANSKDTQCDSCFVVADVAEERSLNCFNVVCVDGKQPLGKQGVRIASVSSGTGELSELSSDGGSQRSDSRTPCPDVVCSECDSVGGHKPIIEEPDKDLMRLSDAEDGLSSEDDSDITGAKNRPPTIVSWKVPGVDRSTIPSIVSKPPNSEISDLGDRQFYADLKERGRKSTNSFPLDDSQHRLDLQDRFFEALVKTHKEKKGFFPRGELSTLVTEDCVFKELTRYFEKTHNETQIRAYARKICEEVPQPKEEDDDRPPKIKSFKKIFAILVLIEQTPCISKFLEEDVNDLDLPLRKLEKGGNGTRFDLRLKRKPEKRLECFRNWTQFPITAFEEWQWTTVSPFFHKGTCREVHHFPLPDSINLPFTSDSRRDNTSDIRTEIEGGYGRVFKVHIHPDHHNFDVPAVQNKRFAIKRLNSQSREDFNNEVEMLKMFNDNAYRHRHLITLLATYEQFRVYHLIFPCADDDLTGYWSRKEPNPSFELKTIKWVAEQCEGIAEGLHRIHKYQTSSSKASTHEKRYGRHGDLKPENILWFSDDNGGMLMISDFGLAEYSTNHSRSYKHKSRVATSMSYRPPECDLKDGQIGQSYDIWTLGCLYLEFITWLLGGWGLVKEFEKKRMSFDPMWYDMDTDAFFELVQCDKNKRPGVIAAMVKPAVTEFIQELHAHESCTDFLHEFIDMIEDDMLIVKPNSPKEKAYHRRRITSEKVYGKLKRMLKQFENPDYACHPSPWRTKSTRPPSIEEVVEVDITDEVVHWKKFRHYEGPVQERQKPETLAVPRTKHGGY